MIKLDQTKSRLVDRLIKDTERKTNKTFNVSQYEKILDINRNLFAKTVAYLEEVCLLEKVGEAYSWGGNKVFLRKEKQSYYLHL